MSDLATIKGAHWMNLHANNRSGVKGQLHVQWREERANGTTSGALM